MSKNYKKNCPEKFQEQNSQEKQTEFALPVSGFNSYYAIVTDPHMCLFVIIVYYYFHFTQLIY